MTGKYGRGRRRTEPQNQRGSRQRLLHRLRLGTFPRHQERRGKEREVQALLHLERKEPASLIERRAVHGELRLNESLKNLVSQGVTQPSNIPWYSQ